MREAAADRAAVAHRAIGDARGDEGHQAARRVGHAPILEEDIALANLALDLIGHATLLLKLAGETEGAGRDEDALAYLREAIDFRNILMAELPKGDFAFTIMRQFLFSVASLYQLEALVRSTHAELRSIATKALKETRYHVRHAGEWALKLGDGTEESHARAQAALDALWRFAGEMFLMDEADERLVRAGIAPDLAPLEPKWRAQVTDVIERATLSVPASGYMQRGGRVGRHTEHLGHMLSEMQILQRSYPGAIW